MGKSWCERPNQTIWPPFNQESFARVSFANKFYEKTKTNFKPSDVQTSFIPSSIFPNLYTPILTDYNSSAGENLSLLSESLEVDKPLESSRLDPHVASFVSLIFK